MTVIESGHSRIRRKKSRRGFDFVLVCAYLSHDQGAMSPIRRS